MPARARHSLSVLLLACSSDPETAASSASGTGTSASATTDAATDTASASATTATTTTASTTTASTSTTAADASSTATASSTTTATADATTTTTATTADATTGGPSVDFPEDAWTPGVAPAVAQGPDLRPLPGDLAGPPIWVSNNPEVFQGDGWLMLNSREDPERGGAAHPLDLAVLYLFHINKSGAARTFHLIATNPAPQPATAQLRGSWYTSVEEPLLGAGTGPSHAVAADWLEGQLRLDKPFVIPSGKGVPIFAAPMPSGAMIDGRLEVDADAGVYFYTVVTSSGDPNHAINLSQGAPAPGIIATPGPNAYGREGGVYAASGWDAALTLALPAADAWLALALNTSAKFALDGVTLQDQTAPALMNLADSSDRTHGNYGHRYRLDAQICNSGPAPRALRLRFVSRFTAPQDVPSQTYNGPVRVAGAVVEVSTRPTAPSVTLGLWTLDPGACQDLPIDLYIPGLITITQELIWESIDPP